MSILCKMLSGFCLVLCMALPLRASDTSQVMADACDTSDPGILHLFDATSFLLNVHVQQFVKNADQTYSMSVGAYTNSPNGPLDPASSFYGTPQAPAGRSGVLITRNTVLTSAHALPFDYTGFIYIFGLRAQNVGGVCQYPDLAHIPKDNVYFASTAANGQYNGVVLNTYTDTAEENDFVVITLDRPVVGRVPLAVRKSGFALAQDRFAGVYFTERLIPPKGDFAIGHMSESSPDGIELENVSLMSGASGGAIFNLDENVVETVGSTSNSCVNFFPENTGLYLLQRNCPGSFFAVNGPVTAISTLAAFPDDDRIFRATFE